MTDNHRGEQLHYVTIEDEPHDLEEEIRGAAGDGDNDSVMNVFIKLYQEGRTEDIEYILSRHLFNEQETATALERIGAAAMKQTTHSL